MRKITFEEIEKHLSTLNNFPNEKAESLIKEMANKQAYIMAYLMGVEGDSFNESEREGFFYLGFSIWYVMKESNEKMPKVIEKIIDETENNNFKMLDMIGNEDEDGLMELIEMIIEDYKQPYLFEYIIESLLEEDEEERIFIPQNTGIMLLYLKTVIDCFDK